jgi:hypothetical protein
MICDHRSLHFSAAPPQKSLAFHGERSATVIGFGRSSAFRDPAPPASAPRWGFGGAALAAHRMEDLNVETCEKAHRKVAPLGSFCRQTGVEDCAIKGHKANNRSIGIGYR